MDLRIPILIFSFITQTAISQQVSDHRLRNIDSFVNRVLKDWNIPGISIAIVEKGKIIYSGGFGYRDVENKLPVTESTLFPIGSCTKAFTCTLLGILENAGKLKLDSPIKNYLPALNFYDEYTTNNITLRDLMCHRSGIPRHNLAWYTSPAGRNELLMRVQYLQPSFKLRTAYQYSNFNYLVLGAVIEKITGKSWEENVQELILDKEAMKSTTPVLTHMTKATDYSLAYISQRDSGVKTIPFYSNIDAMGAAGSLNSSAKDMCNWLLAWTNAGNYNGTQIFPLSYWRQAISIQISSGSGLPTADNPNIYFAGYGFGWNLSSYKGHYRADHDGVIDGFVSNTSFFPSDSIGIFVVGNQDMPVYAIRNFISDCLLKLSQKNWNQYYLEGVKKIKRPPVATNNAAKTVEAPEKYTGSYYNKGYGTMKVILKNNNPEIVINGFTIRLVEEKKNQFKGFLRYPHSNSEIPLTILFTSNKKERVTHVSIPLEPSVRPILFDKIR